MIPTNNSFTFLRLILASMVIFTHSYSIVGLEETDLLNRMSGGQTKFSVLAVNSFFVLSGYLITFSFNRSSSLSSYLFKRVLRIVPAYWAVILVSFVLFLSFSEKSIFNVLNSSQTWTYLINNLLFRVHYYIDGFLGGSAINGSLWTIPYELFFYLFITIFIWFKNSFSKVFVLISFVFFYILSTFSVAIWGNQSLPIIWLSINEILRLGSFFLAGSLLSYFDANDFQNRNYLKYGSLVLLISSMLVGKYSFIEPILLPLLILSLGLTPNKFLDRFVKNGDYSYGIYLWAFPIQQTLNFVFQFTSPTLLTFVTIPIAYFAGAISWHFVEKPFLLLKRF